VLGDPPAGEPIWKMSMLPDDQDDAREGRGRHEAAIEGNQFGRKPV
jgi:hypothetical protein